MHPHSSKQPAAADTQTVSRPETQDSDEQLRAAMVAELRGPETPATNSTTDARILAYTRVSRSIQVSIPDQQRAINDDAARFGWVVDRHRSDIGSRWDDERPDYRRTLDDIESKQFTHLWTFNADRLGGDDQEFVATVSKAISCGMVVRDTVHGEITPMLARFLGVISYLEIEHNHYRVMLSLEGKHLQGVKLGTIPTGYEPQCRLHPCRCGLHGKPVPSEPRASLVRTLFRRYAAGDPLAHLQQWWNAQTGERRKQESIRSMLGNAYYAGIITNCRTRNGRVKGRGKRERWEWKVGTHEHPLVDPRTFAVVQERLHSQENHGQHRTHGVSHPLVGLVFCVRCERRMKIHANRGHSTTWECALCTRSRSVCKLERALHSLLAQIPFPEEAAVQNYAADQARLQHALKQELAAIDAERDRITRRRSVWADDRGDGTMSKDEYRAKIAETDRQLDELRQQQAGLEGSHIAQPGRAALLSEVRAALQRMGNWTTTIAGMTDEEKRAMYRCTIKAIRLDLLAGTMSVEYTDALARWCGRASDTAPLPSQKAH